MSRKFNLFFTVMAIFATALWTGTAGAGIPGSAHDTAAGAAGACSACHIPHGGGAQRLWPTGAGTGTYTGVVAPLCASCHSTTGGYSGSMANAASDGYVYGALSHGSLMSQTAPPWSTDVASSGLPYASQATNFECTTCHDVHNDPAATNPTGNRPFLRDTLNQICARCHTNRHFVGGNLSEGGTVTAGAWGGNAQVGQSNPGSHPVGNDITGDNFGGGSNIVIATQMRVLTNNIAGAWSLGGHLTANASGGVTCVSCHAVHGGQIDGQDNTAGQVSFSAFAPNTNYLAIAQAVTNKGGRTVANGAGGYNALCEGCHGGGADPSGYAGAFNPNPGAAGTYSHPIDDYPSNYDAGVTAFPGTGDSQWPAGGSAGGGPSTGGTNVAPIPICESCHQPHVAAEIAGNRADVTADAGDYILRDDYQNFCNNCHTSTIAGHHPVGVTYNGQGVSYLTNVTGVSGETLTCASCHAGPGGAHNWTAGGFIGLDNNWIPANNGRSTTQATDMYNTDMSKTCIDCHYGMDGDRASVSPTLGTSATASVGLEAEFQTLDASMGTHYIGLVHTTDNNWFNSPLVDIFSQTQTWLAQVTGYDNQTVGQGWARFGGNASAPVLVCESCHELEPDKNVGAGGSGHLLLAAYGEGNNGDESGKGADASTGRDILCEACHGVPSGTHALSGQTVSRTGTTLSTTASWLRGTVLGDATLGTNVLSCDGCHQPHDANTASYTFILDAPASVTFPSGSHATVGAGTVESTNPAATTEYPTATGSGGYATPTLQNKGGEFTGFCDQCHVYAY